MILTLLQIRIFCNHVSHVYFIFLVFIFWLLWVFVAACRLSVVAESGGFSSCGALALGARASVVAALGLSSWGTWALEHASFSNCGLRALQCSACSVVVAHWLSCSVACGIFLGRGRTRVPCIGRRILNYCATREVPPHVL